MATKKKTGKLHLYYDAEGDYFELWVGRPQNTYMRNRGKGIFERIDERNGAVRGVAILNFKKRTAKCTPIDITLPQIPLLHA